MPFHMRKKYIKGLRNLKSNKYTNKNYIDKSEEKKEEIEEEKEEVIEEEKEVVVEEKEKAKNQIKIKNLKKLEKAFPLNLNEYSIIQEIGSGSNSHIYLVYSHKVKKKFALKQIIVNNEEQLEKYKTQIQLLYSLNTECIVPFLKFKIKKLDILTYAIYILMPLAKSDWHKKIEDEGVYTEELCMKILKKLVNTFSYLQENNIAHRDIKPQNILIFDNEKNADEEKKDDDEEEDVNYFISDFDEFISLDENLEEDEKLQISGTEMYLSPILYKAVYEDNKFVKHNVFKSDVFSLGLCILYAITNNTDYLVKFKIQNDFQNKRLLKKFVNSNECKYVYSNEFINLLLFMLKQDEKFRCDFIQLKEKINEYVELNKNH